MESYKKLIGKKIQRRRVERGYANQTSLAEKLGVDQSQVSKWESGKNMPEGQLKASLADLLQVEDDFFEMIDIRDMVTDDRRAELFNLVLSLPDVNVDTFTTIAKGLLAQSAMNQKKSGT